MTKPLSPDAIPRGLSGYMMVIEEPMDEAEKWLVTIEAHCSVLDDIPANKELTDAIRSNVVEVRQALAAKDAEIAGLRLLIRGEQTKPPFDVADDQTTEMAVEIAALTADLAARGETIVRLEGEVERVREASGDVTFDHDFSAPIPHPKRPIIFNFGEKLKAKEADIATLSAQLIEERWQKDRAEFAIEHPMAVSRDDSPLFCLKCHGGEPDHRWNDPRHAYTPDDWRRDAREQWDAEQAAKVTPK